MSRRGLVVLAIVVCAAAGAILAAVGPAEDESAPIGDTRRVTLADPDGDGLLTRAPGEPLRDRTAVAPRAPLGRELARFALIADAHVRDEESPARGEFLDRLGGSFRSAFRPQEALSAQVLDATVRSVNRSRAQALLVNGDLVDSAQANEIDLALGVLRGGRARPDSGARGYDGVQDAANPDPFFYRPDVDPPVRRGLLERAQRPFAAQGLRAPWLPAIGNHDVLVAGELPPTPLLTALARGDSALREVDVAALAAGADRIDPSRPDPATIERLLTGGLSGERVAVPADPRRGHLTGPQVVQRLRAASGAGGRGPRLDHVADVGERLRIITVDAVSRDGIVGGSDGEGGARRDRVLAPAQRRLLSRELRRAGRRWVVVQSHRPLGDDALRLLAASERVVALVHGDTHDHAIRTRELPGGRRVWQVGTASLADYPQQARAFRLVATRGGGVALETWVLDHAGTKGAATARDLAFLDAQGGRPLRRAGRPADRNARLFAP